MGLHGPYSMYFSRSGTPGTDIDTSFFANLGIKGYVAANGRGKVTGKASGADSSMKWVVHWYVSSLSVSLPTCIKRQRSYYGE